MTRIPCSDWPSLAGVPTGVNYKTMEDDLRELAGVVAIHNLHVWSLTMDKTALAVHLAIGNYRATNRVAR